MDASVTLTGEYNPDGSPALSILLHLAMVDSVVSLDFQEAQRLLMLLHKTIGAIQEKGHGLWSGMRPLLVCEEPGGYIKTSIQSGGIDEDSDGSTRISETMDDWKREITQQVMDERRENCACPLCGDPEWHSEGCELAELDDVDRILTAVSEVYNTVTNGLISEPNTDPAMVKAAFDDYMNELCAEARAEERALTDQSPIYTNGLVDIDDDESIVSRGRPSPGGLHERR